MPAKRGNLTVKGHSASRKFAGGLLFASLFLIPTTFVFGQVNQLETDKGIDAAIAPYDSYVRDAILEASQYPNVLTQLQKRQSQTVQAFNDMIGGYSERKQAWFYTITRYPDLMHALATLPDKKSKDDIYKLLPNQDENLKGAAWKLYRHNKDELIKLDNLNISAQQDLNKAIQNLNAPANAAFLKLSAMPDVLTLLTNNIDLTTRLGEHYKNNSIELKDRLAAIHDSLNVQNEYEIEAYKKEMADDPEAKAELSEAARAYAKANGIDVPPPQQNDESDNINYYAYPYSYWFGYPWWYSYPLWYPGSFWYDTGLYFGMGGFGIWGLPGWGFSDWYFNRGYYNRYPHLYRHFDNYYHNAIRERRYMGPVNDGFMRHADGHFNPSGGYRPNRLTAPSLYSRPRVQFNGSFRNATRINANSYHSQSWGAFGGRDNSIGRGFGGGRRR